MSKEKDKPRRLTLEELNEKDIESRLADIAAEGEHFIEELRRRGEYVTDNEFLYSRDQARYDRAAKLDELERQQPSAANQDESSADRQP